MLSGDEWKTGEANAPTPEDVVKYASQGSKLLLTLPYYGHLAIQEVVIGEIANGGEYFKTLCPNIFGTGGTWYQTSETRLLAIIPWPAPVQQKRTKTTLRFPTPVFSVDKGVKRKPKRKKAK